MIKRIRNLLDDKTILSTYPILFLITGLFVISTLLTMAAFASPIADDYAYFSHHLINNPFRYVYDFYLNNTGRIAQGGFVSILFSVFGESVVVFGPIIELILLAGVCIWLTHLLIRSDIPHRKLNVISIGIFGAITMLLMSPSLFDSYLWFTSSSVYITSLIGLIFNTALLIVLLRQKRLKVWYILLVCLSVFICQSFSEPTSAIIIAMLSLVMLSAFIYKHRRLLLLSSTGFASAVAGFLFVYLSPGSQARQDASGSAFDINGMLLQPFLDLGAAFQLLFSWRFFIILSLALLIAHILPKFNKKTSLQLMFLSMLLALGPIYLLFLITHYSMGDYTPLRAYTVPMAIFGIFIAFLIALGISMLLKRLTIRYRMLILTPLAVASVTAGLITTTPQLNTIIRAEVIRESLHDNRAASIADQIEENRPTISIHPAPIFLNNSEAIDFYYQKAQIDWYEAGFKRYYGIPHSTHVTFKDQPESYCLNEQNPTWFGLQTCYALAEDE